MIRRKLIAFDTLYKALNRRIDDFEDFAQIYFEAGDLEKSHDFEERSLALEELRRDLVSYQYGGDLYDKR